MVQKDSEISELDGVYRLRIEIPFDVKFVCVFLFELEGKRILIDAGLNILPWKKKFLSLLKQINVKIEDIDYCIITHEHLDHNGLLKFIKRKNPYINILMHEFTNYSLNFSADPEKYAQMEENAKKFATLFNSYGMEQKYIQPILSWFLQWPKIVRYQQPDVILKDDDEVSIGSSKLRIIWTPGHSIGHICVFNEKNSHLFSGDHILSRITPHIGQYHMLSLFDSKYICPNILKSYLNSLDKIERLNPKLIFPAHQEIIENPLERIADIKKHHQRRFQEISKLIKNNPLTPFEISQIHFGNNLDNMNKYLAINEILSHLIYLEQENKVNRICKNGKILFTS